MTFYVMCISFGLNHAAVTVPIGYATTLLGTQVGNASNSALYGVCMLASLFCGPLFTSTLGPKNALVLGMILYVVYVLCFAFALLFIDQVIDDNGIEQNSPEAMAWVLAVGGAVIGGVGAGSLWTAQGAFFGAICGQISEATGRLLQDVTAQLSSTFAFIFLGQECFWKVLYTLLTAEDFANISNFIIMLVYGGLATVASVVMFLGNDARPKTATNAPICTKATAALSMWSDPKIWLLSGSNFTFGFGSAYLNGYINGNWTKKALDPQFLGFLGAIVALIATISSWVYGFAAEKMGTKIPVFILLSVCYLSIAGLSFITAPMGEGPGGWGWGIMVFYVLQGLGRGVYESTNKGIFADFFPGEKSTGAFANCILQNTGASTITFLMGTFNYGQQEVWLCLFGAALTVPMLFVALLLKRKALVEDSDKATLS